MNTNTKISEVLLSRNFLVSIISLFLMVLSFNSIDSGLDAGSIYDMIKTKNIAMIALVGVSILSIGTKLLAKITSKTFDWSFYKSPNFATQLLTIITIVVGSLFSESVAALIITVLTNIINVIYHISTPAKTA